MCKTNSNTYDTKTTAEPLNCFWVVSPNANEYHPTCFGRVVAQNADMYVLHAYLLPLLFAFAHSENGQFRNFCCVFKPSPRTKPSLPSPNTGSHLDLFLPATLLRP